MPSDPGFTGSAAAAVSEYVNDLRTDYVEVRRGIEDARYTLKNANQALVRAARKYAEFDDADLSLLLGGQPDDDAAAVLGVGVALDVPARGEPVDPVRHRPAGHQGLAQQPAGGELVRRTGAPQRGQDVELPRLDPVVGERLPAGEVEVAGQPRDPAEDGDRRQVEVAALARPRLDQLVDLVPHVPQSSGRGRES